MAEDLLSGIRAFNKNEFALGEWLGEGGEATVRRGKHKTMGEMAVKLFKTSKMKVEKYKVDADKNRELKALIKCANHQNIIRFFGYIKDCNVICGYVMELVKGNSLFKVLHESDSIYSMDTMLEHAQQIACALSFLHSIDVLHRDVKPDNILVFHETAKLSDFGCTTEVAKKSLTACVGTYSYMAPEMLMMEERGQYDTQCDVYSFGITTLGNVYEMVGVHIPYAELNDMAVVYHVQGGGHPPLKKVTSEGSEDLKKQIERMDVRNNICRIYYGQFKFPIDLCRGSSKMSTFNDTESVTTLSEMNSICGDSTVDKIALLEEKIRRMEAAKQVQAVPPSWITTETEAVEQCLDDFRVAFNEAKQCILEKRGVEDVSQNYEERKKAAKLTEELNEVWMSAARDVKKHLSGITRRLNGCCGNNSDLPDKTVGGELWMNVILPNISADELPVLNPTDILPDLSTKAVKICKRLVGTWKFDDNNRPIPNELLVPLKIVISYHTSGFLIFERRTNSGSSIKCFRPDGKRYAIKGASNRDRACAVNDDHQILFRFIHSGGKPRIIRCCYRVRTPFSTP